MRLRLCELLRRDGNPPHPSFVIPTNNFSRRAFGAKEANGLPWPDDMAIQNWEWGWQWRAACRGEDAALFFAPNHFEVKEEKASRERRAKAICAGCAVRYECLDYAVRTGESHGIWGGLNELERRLLVRQRTRAALSAVPSVSDEA